MAEQRDKERLMPAIKALTALVNLGLDESVLMQALVSEDPKALEEINRTIAVSENKAEILQKLRHATEAMQAEVDAVGTAEATQLKQVIVNELTQQEATAPVAAQPVEPPVERWVIAGEDHAAIAAEEASLQRQAIANLTRAEFTPAVTGGASELWHSAFELLKVTGADSESINTYLAEQARARGKKSVAEIRDDEFHAIVNDTKSFQQWSARRWVDQFINQRKDEMRQLAEAKTATSYVGSRRGRSFRDPVLDSPLAGKFKQDRTALNTAQSELAERRRVDSSALEATRKELEQQHAEALAIFEKQMAGQQLEVTTIEALVAQQRSLFETIQQQILTDKQAASAAYHSAAEAELTKRKTELDQLSVETRYAVTKGVKRELVLSADRWGRALDTAVKAHPELIRKDETTGDISIAADVITNQPEVLQAMVEQLGKEVDRVFEAKTASGDKANRIHNLEALITSSAEAAIAEQYLKQLLDNYTKMGEQSRLSRSETVSRKEAALQKHDLVWNFLVDKKFASTEHELRALPVYIDAKKDLPSALPVLAEQYGQEIDGPNRWSIHMHASRQVTQLLEARVKQAEGNTLLHPSFLEGLQKMAEAVGKPEVLSDNYNARRIVDNILSTFEKWRGGSIDFIKRTIYQSATKNEYLLWTDRDLGHLANIVVGDFAGRYDEVDNYQQDQLSTTAFGQIELNARSWAKTNRPEAKAWLDRVAAKVQDSCAAKMPDTRKTFSQAVDAANAVAAWQAKAEQVAAVVKNMEKLLGKIATLKAEI